MWGRLKLPAHGQEGGRAKEAEGVWGRLKLQAQGLVSQEVTCLVVEKT